jgi:carboxylesterase
MIFDYRLILSRRLLAWSVFSLVGGIALLTLAGPFWRGVGLLALPWSAIDAAVALFSLRGLAEKLSGPVDPDEAKRKTLQLRRILWINTGLSALITLVGTGLLLYAESANYFVRGSASGVIFQGGFLFLFNLIHAFCIPQEVTLPDWGLFSGEEHRPFSLPGHKGVALLVHGFPGTPTEMRAIGKALNDSGWAVRGLLLPGFGRELPALYQQRTAGWIETIAQAVREARDENLPVALVGFSMGGGLSVSAAAQEPPDLLVLVSPFWWDESILLRALAWFARLFLPASIRPFKYVPLSVVQVEQPAQQMAPEIDFKDPRVQQVFHNLQIPLVFLEQFRQIGRYAKRSAPGLKMPTLVLQGAQDPLVKPRRTRRLVKWIGAPARYIELPGEHHIVWPTSPAYEPVTAAVIAFLNAHIQS